MIASIRSPVTIWILGDFGKPGNYFARQVDRWTKQYRASETQHIPEVERLIEWLPRTLPEQARVSIVHGDYRLDNMIFQSDRRRGCRRCSTGNYRHWAIQWPTSPIC